MPAERVPRVAGMVETLHTTNARCGTKPYKARTGVNLPSRHVATHPLGHHQDNEVVRFTTSTCRPGVSVRRTGFVRHHSRRGKNCETPGARAGDGRSGDRPDASCPRGCPGPSRDSFCPRATAVHRQGSRTERSGRRVASPFSVPSCFDMRVRLKRPSCLYERLPFATVFRVFRPRQDGLQLYTRQLDLTARAGLPRHQPDPRRKLAPGSERLHIPHRCNCCGRRQRPDTRYRGNCPAGLVLSLPCP